jgi:hypothetical protein
MWPRHQGYGEAADGIGKERCDIEDTENR